MTAQCADALFFMSVVAMLVFTSAREWWLVLSRRKPAIVHEAAFVPTTLVAETDEVP